MTHRGPFQPRRFCDSVISGVLCHVLGSPVQESHGHIGAQGAMKELEHLELEKRLRKLELMEE